MADHTIKGLTPSTVNYDASNLRVAIVHARWNKPIIDALVSGSVAKLLEKGVKQSNIVIQTVPGSFELPLACSKVISAGHVQAGATATDLLGGLNFGGPSSRSGTPNPFSPNPSNLSQSTSSISATIPNAPFDAVIAIGVLIKGSTMHFEYICDAVSHALMKLQMDSGVPVIFGVLTCLTEEQAFQRAGLSPGSHNHGDDWALAAIEMGSQCKSWGQGKFTA